MTRSNAFRILIVTDSLSSSSGGLGVASFRLACESAKSDPDSSFLLVSMADSNSDCVLDHLIPSNLDVQIAKSFRINSLAFSIHFLSLCLSFSPDIMHVRGIWRFPSLAALFCKLFNPSLRIVVQPAGMLEPWSIQQKSFLKTFYFHFIEGWLFRKAFAIHATSYQEAKNLFTYGISQEKLFTISSGVDLPDIDKLYNVKHMNSRRLLFLSRLHPKKGLSLLLDSLSEVLPENWECIIAGSGSASYLSYLDSKIQSYGMSKSVKMVGTVLGSRKEKLYASSDAFILPTFSENFGIAVAEAMSWALPVITTTGTPWKCLKDEGLGWYVEPTVASISDALTELFSCSDEQLSEMGFKARKKIELNYSWQASGQLMASTYRQMLNAARS